MVARKSASAAASKIPSGYRYGFHDDSKPAFSQRKGIDEQVVTEISQRKREPEWMLAKRLEGLRLFQKLAMPDWAPNLPIDFDELCYYSAPTQKSFQSWDEVPAKVRNTFERLGIPQAEREFLAGVAAQYDSEAVYHNLRKSLSEKGVVFEDFDSALEEHGDIIRKYFGSIVPASDNKFAALNTAAWSGGSFIRVPSGVSVDIPLQAYFRINARNLGQFERTLIIAEPGSFVHYIEGCSAPIYSAQSLHAAVVEILAMPGSRVRYTTIQNWSSDVYNLVTKRAKAMAGATVEWIDGNIGSKVTMKYPCILLAGEGARGEIVSVAFAGKGQLQDAGAKMIHLAPNTSSRVISKSISAAGGKTVYRGTIQVAPGVFGVRASSQCDALMLDSKSSSDTVPRISAPGDKVRVTHEATVSRLDEEKLFYLQSRGFSKQAASQLLVQGFIEPFVRELPLEYAVELNRLISLEMDDNPRR